MLANKKPIPFIRLWKKAWKLTITNTVHTVLTWPAYAASQMCFQPSTGEELPFSDQHLHAALSPSLSKISSKCLIYSIFFNNFSAEFQNSKMLASTCVTLNYVQTMVKYWAQHPKSTVQLVLWERLHITGGQPTAFLLHSCRCVSSHYDCQLQLRSACLTTVLHFYMRWLLWPLGPVGNFPQVQLSLPALSSRKSLTTLHPMICITMEVEMILGVKSSSRLTPSSRDGSWSGSSSRATLFNQHYGYSCSTTGLSSLTFRPKSLRGRDFLFGFWHSILPTSST